MYDMILNQAPLGGKYLTGGAASPIDLTRYQYITKS